VKLEGYVFQAPDSTLNPPPAGGLTIIYFAINYNHSLFELRGLCGFGAWHPYSWVM
jgi:hypothetical protein